MFVRFTWKHKFTQEMSWFDLGTDPNGVRVTARSNARKFLFYFFKNSCSFLTVWGLFKGCFMAWIIVTNRLNEALRKAQTPMDWYVSRTSRPAVVLMMAPLSSWCFMKIPNADTQCSTKSSVSDILNVCCVSCTWWPCISDDPSKSALTKSSSWLSAVPRGSSGICLSGLHVLLHCRGFSGLINPCTSKADGLAQSIPAFHSTLRAK